MLKSGVILAVCTSPNSNLPKYMQPEVVVGKFGFVGDYHCKPMRRSFSKPGTEKPNDDRHITVLAFEAVCAVNHELGLDLQPGSLAENILTQGLGDLSDVRDGQIIRIGQFIQLDVVKQNKPCKNTAVLHPEFNKTIYHPLKQRRGLLCKVTRGVGLTIRPGDVIKIL